jgi:ParB family transcriptional regulator, chromosome partitioning protein
MPATESYDMSQIASVNPFRCRLWDLHDRLDNLVTEDTCREEIASFAKHGQLIPALGRRLHGDPDHDIELICGARRLFVARHLNVQLLVDLREMSDHEAIIAMDIENRQRKDISPYERGMSFARFLRGGHFESQEHLAKAIKISQPQVSRLLALARLPSVVINAFGSPAEIRETWGLDLAAALRDPSRRGATIARARALSSVTPRPPAIQVYQQLICAAVNGRKIRMSSHDEVVTDLDGTPLFRIRQQEKTISMLLPRNRVSREVLDAVRDTVREVLQRNTYHPRARAALLREPTAELIRTRAVLSVPGVGRC